MFWQGNGELQFQRVDQNLSSGLMGLLPVGSKGCGRSAVFDLPGGWVAWVSGVADGIAVGVKIDSVLVAVINGSFTGAGEMGWKSGWHALRSSRTTKKRITNRPTGTFFCVRNRFILTILISPQSNDCHSHPARK